MNKKNTNIVFEDEQSRDPFYMLSEHGRRQVRVHGVNVYGTGDTLELAGLTSDSPRRRLRIVAVHEYETKPVVVFVVPAENFETTSVDEALEQIALQVFDSLPGRIRRQHGSPHGLHSSAVSFKALVGEVRG